MNGWVLEKVGMSRMNRWVLEKVGMSGNLIASIETSKL